MPKGKITREVGHIIDFMPTFLELAGGQYPKKHKGEKILPVEGKSLVAVLKGGERAGHDKLAWEWSGNRALREGKWKLVWDKLEKRWALFDLKADRTETNDLASANPERTMHMIRAWFAWAEKTGFKVSKLAGKPKLN